MKLSEAILLGSVGSEQGRGKLVDGNKTCAMGAAAIAIGLTKLGEYADSSLIVELIRIWPEISSMDIACPVCGSHNSLHWIIGMHLNDTHLWTRPHIAEWVASIEPKEVQVEQPITEEVLCEVK